MSMLLICGITFCVIGAIMLFINALFMLFGESTDENRMKYIGGNVAAATDILAGIAFFVLDIALKLGTMKGL